MASAPDRRLDFNSRGRIIAALAVLAAAATGCKSGTWGTKPSWWSSSGPPPAASLTSPPALDKGVTKPSEMAKPYPTTDTPQPYSMSQAGEGGSAITAEPASITYGTTPPATAAAAPPPAEPPARPGSIGPQVGAYTSLQPAAESAAGDPAAAATAGFAAAPSFNTAAPPAAGPRVADARGDGAWSAPPPASSAASRYASSSGSRFSGTVEPPAVESRPVVGGSQSIDPAAGNWPPVAPPVAQPVPPSAGALPGTIAPPQRRPDPGYRPGGTSSYQPSRAILAGEDGGEVMPASFEAAAGP